MVAPGKRARLELLGTQRVKKFIFPAVLGGLAVLVCAAAIFLSWKSGIARALQKGEPIFGLIVGADLVDNARHADTIILARYLPNERNLDLLSIPRDTRVELPNIRVRRINEVYAYAFRASKRDSRQAVDALWEAVSGLLFTSSETARPTLHFYAQIDYDGFRKIIDLLGGVEVAVDEPMHYDDNWGKLHIHFSTGVHHLNGQKALEYVRFRGVAGDSGRVSRQQGFLLKLLHRVAQPASMVRLPGLVAAALKFVDTNLSIYDCLLAVHELRGVTRDQVRLIQLPGSARRGYWMPDAEDVRTTAGFMSSSHPREAAAGRPERQAQTDFSKVTVEVWNASSKAGLALEVVRSLRDAGFDVVKWGNFASRQKKTFVRDHRGGSEAAQAVVRSLKTPNAEIFTRLEANPLVDLEVVLGQDYTE